MVKEKSSMAYKITWLDLGGKKRESTEALESKKKTLRVIAKAKKIARTGEDLRLLGASHFRLKKVA